MTLIRYPLGKMWWNFAGPPEDNMDDEQWYAKVVEELRASGPMPGLWAKAFAESAGNEPAAKALYLRLRVAQLQGEELDRRQAAAKAEEEEEARALAEVAEQKARKREREPLTTKEYWMMFLMVFLILVIALVAITAQPLPK